MKLENYLNEGRRKIDFYMDYGYIGSSNAVDLNKRSEAEVNHLSSPSSMKEVMVVYFILAILDEAKMTDEFNQIKKILDKKYLRKK
jgi:hypothetical protein